MMLKADRSLRFFKGGELQLTAIRMCPRTCSLQLPPRQKPDASSGMTAVPPPQTCCVSPQLLQTRRTCALARQPDGQRRTERRSTGWPAASHASVMERKRKRGLDVVMRVGRYSRAHAHSHYVAPLRAWAAPAGSLNAASAAETTN